MYSLGRLPCHGESHGFNFATATNFCKSENEATTPTHCPID